MKFSSALIAVSSRGGHQGTGEAVARVRGANCRCEAVARVAWRSTGQGCSGDGGVPSVNGTSGENAAARVAMAATECE